MPNTQCCHFCKIEFKDACRQNFKHSCHQPTKLKIENFHCSEHGYIKPIPTCPECKSRPPEPWEEELKRQCEIRNLPFADVKYLVTETLQNQKETLAGKIEKLKQSRPMSTEISLGNIKGIFDNTGYNQAIDSILTLLKDI